MKPIIIKRTVVTALLIAAILTVLSSCNRHTYGRCEGREKMIGYGTPTKDVLKHYKN